MDFIKNSILITIAFTIFVQALSQILQ